MSDSDVDIFDLLDSLEPGSAEAEGMGMTEKPVSEEMGMTETPPVPTSPISTTRTPTTFKRQDGGLPCEMEETDSGEEDDTRPPIALGTTLLELPEVEPPIFDQCHPWFDPLDYRVNIDFKGDGKESDFVPTFWRFLELLPERTIDRLTANQLEAVPEPLTKIVPPPPPLSKIPHSLRTDATLLQCLNKALPKAYNFEVLRILWRILRANWTTRTISHVALQLPDGLLAWGPAIASIIERFGAAGSGGGGASQIRVTVLADVTYGACCVDDLTANLLGVDLLVHFGHSCLVPVEQTAIKVMYVHVSMDINVGHLVETIRANFFESTQNLNPFGNSRLEGSVAILGTIQFTHAINDTVQQLSTAIPNLVLHNNSSSQTRPLSPGEVLGCTAPTLPKMVEEVVFICDGRFHLEAVMMANPHCKFYLYNPYDKKLTEESYDYKLMLELRSDAVSKVGNLVPGSNYGKVLGTSQGQTEETQHSQPSSESAPNNSKVNLLNDHPEKKLLRRLGEGLLGLKTGLDGLKPELSDKEEENEEKCQSLMSHFKKGLEQYFNVLRPAVRLQVTSQESMRKIDDWVEYRGKKAEVAAVAEGILEADREASGGSELTENSELKQDTAVKQKPTTEKSKPICGLILGTLGRQGNVALLNRLLAILSSHEVEGMVFLLSEISPSSLSAFESDKDSGKMGVDFWVQVACPRLSIDWGSAFGKSVLTTYEFYKLFENNETKEQNIGKIENINTWLERERNLSTDTGAGTAGGCGSGSTCGSATAGEGGGSGGCCSAKPDAVAALWPEMDYYSLAGGGWGNYSQ